MRRNGLRPYRFEDHWRQCKRDRLEAELAGFDLGKIEDVVDDRQQRLGGRFDGAKVMPLFGVERRIEGQFGHPDDAVHRRPNFVAHVGQKGATRLADGFGSRFCGQRISFRLAEGRHVALQDNDALHAATLVAGHGLAFDEQPGPRPGTGTETAFALKKRGLAPDMRSDGRIEALKIVNMDERTPCGKGVLEVAVGKTEQLLPMTPGINAPAPEIPVGERIPGKLGLDPLDCGKLRNQGVGHGDQPRDTIGERRMLRRRSVQQPPQGRFALGAEDRMDPGREQRRFHRALARTQRSPRTSCMSNWPFCFPARKRAARRLPSAYGMRLPALWLISTRSPVPQYITV